MHLEELKKEAELLSEERGLLLKEVNHRVKNNLALIIGMLNLEANKRNSEQYSLFIDDIVCRVNALSTVHSLLSANHWRPVYLRELCQLIIVSALPQDKHPRVDINASDLTINASQAHNLSLIINELATNTAKYALEAPQVVVSVQITTIDTGISIVYQDNGPGYPQAIFDDTFSGAGIGVQMMKGIVKMSLAGNISFRNDNGARTDIDFPLTDSEEGIYGA